MATIKELHDLVHALDKNEKKYVSQLIEALGGKAKDRYASTFKIINEQKVFDAEKLKDKLSAGVSGMNLTEANSNVYDFIAKALVGYAISSELGFAKQLSFIEILISKKLLDTAHRLLQKLAPEIEAKGKFSQIQRFYEMQEHITIQHPRVNVDYEFRSAFFDRRLALIKTMEQHFGFLNLQFRFFRTLKEIGQPRTTEQLSIYEELWNSPMLKLKPEEVEGRNLLYYYNMRMCIGAALSHPDAVDVSFRCIKEFSQTEIGKESKESVSQLIGVYLTLLVTAEKINPADFYWAKERLLSTIDGIPHKAQRESVYAKVLMAELAYYLKADKYEEGIAHYDQALRDGERDNWKDAILNYAIPWFAARLHYLAKNPDKALDCLLLVTDQEKMMRGGIHLHYQFLKLLCHYKLGNQLLVESTATALYKGLLKQEKLYAPERALLKFFKKSTSIDVVRQRMQGLYDALLEMQEDRLTKAFFDDGDYFKWLEMELNQSRQN